MEKFFFIADFLRNNNKGSDMLRLNHSYLIIPLRFPFLHCFFFLVDIHSTILEWIICKSFYTCGKTVIMIGYNSKPNSLFTV